MAAKMEFTGLSEGEGVIYRSSEDPTSIDRKRHEEFVKWVDAHEERVRKIICNSRQFAGEQFCGLDYRSDFERTFLWAGSAP
jgi:hypothetical protein